MKGSTALASRCLRSPLFGDLTWVNWPRKSWEVCKDFAKEEEEEEAELEGGEEMEEERDEVTGSEGEEVTEEEGRAGIVGKVPWVLHLSPLQPAKEKRNKF